jgi:hypothetical protein
MNKIEKLVILLSREKQLSNSLQKFITDNLRTFFFSAKNELEVTRFKRILQTIKYLHSHIQIKLKLVLKRIAKLEEENHCDEKFLLRLAYIKQRIYAKKGNEEKEFNEFLKEIDYFRMSINFYQN